MNKSAYNNMTEGELLAQLTGWANFIRSQAKFDNTVTSDGADIIQAYIAKLPEVGESNAGK